MAKRDNLYEVAFEAFLLERRIPYVAVDETRRSLSQEASLKNPDFLVSTTRQTTWLVDVKGRRFPAGSQKQYWRNWSTREDLESLSRWERLMGDRTLGLLVFAYLVTGDQAPLPQEELFEFREHLFGFVGIRLVHYVAHSKTISPRWGTVAMPVAKFRELAEPFHCLV